jgi:hypothetical protein
MRSRTRRVVLGRGTPGTTIPGRTDCALRGMGHAWWYHDGRGTIDKLAGMISFNASETALLLFSPSGTLDLASATTLALRALARISVKGEIRRRQFAVVEDRHLSVGGCDGTKQGARQGWDPSVALLHLQTGGFAARERRGRTTSFPEGEMEDYSNLRIRLFSFVRGRAGTRDTYFFRAQG